MSAIFSWGSNKDADGRSIDANATQLRLPASATDADLARLAQLCQQLQRLNLESCAEIFDAALAHLAPLQQLHSLDLTGTEITDSGLLNLAVLQLQSLDTDGTYVTDEGLAAFWAAQARAAAASPPQAVSKAQQQQQQQQQQAESL